MTAKPATKDIYPRCLKIKTIIPAETKTRYLPYLNGKRYCPPEDCAEVHAGLCHINQVACAVRTAIKIRGNLPLTPRNAQRKNRKGSDNNKHREENREIVVLQPRLPCQQLHAMLARGAVEGVVEARKGDGDEQGVLQQLSGGEVQAVVAAQVVLFGQIARAADGDLAGW